MNTSSVSRGTGMCCCKDFVFEMEPTLTMAYQCSAVDSRHVCKDQDAADPALVQRMEVGPTSLTLM